MPTHRKYIENAITSVAFQYDRWMNSFENFLADMGRRPSRKLSIDRRGNDGNYEPGNCW